VPKLPKLTQADPRHGAEPTHDTDVRVAYGDKGLYVAFVCYDDPEDVRSGYGRRDQMPPSDEAMIEIDPNHDRTNGYHFAVNPSGAQRDGQIYRDDRLEWSWDGVWKSAARKHDKGWSAEMFIPWSTMRFEARHTYTFGINIARVINKEEEVVALSVPPQGVPGRMSFAHDYVGVKGVEPGLNLELRPYISGRFAVRRPSGSLDRSWRALPNAGIESKYGLRGNLTLDVAVNPDFGQAEVDPAVLNLGPFEVFFPEKRQFFLESKEIFETRFQLFYSRRVGNNPSPGHADTVTRTVAGQEEYGELVEVDPQTRILDAVRVTGDAAKGWRVGAMTATTGPTFGVQRFSDGSEHPVTVDPTTQYSVARLRRQFDSQTYIGGIATAVNRADGEPDAYTGGVDYAVTFRRNWQKRAQVIGTHDGTQAGMGASGELERSAKNWEVELDYGMLTPHANFNDIGFMQHADYISGGLELGVFSAQPVGQARHLRAGVHSHVSSTFDGVITQKMLHFDAGLTTEKLWNLGVSVGGHPPRMDPYETRGGILYRAPGHWWTGVHLGTPYNRKVHYHMHVAYGEQGGGPGPDLDMGVTLRPVDRLQLGVWASVHSALERERWVGTNDDDEPVFGRADMLSTEGTLGGTLGITPTLTLQTFNQLLYSTAHHDAFFVLESPTTLVWTDPRPYEGYVDQSLTALTSNSILRWEYMPGSFLYAVYTHRTVLDAGGMVVTFRPGSAFSDLVADTAEHEDLIFVKLVHLFGL
jgi:hypothetical protein